MKSINERDYYTVAEVAEILDVSHSTVWRWIRAEKLPAYRVGSRNLRVRKQDLEAARSQVVKNTGNRVRIEEARRSTYDTAREGTFPAASDTDEEIPWKDLTPEERRKRLFRPLSEEERQEQWALFERVMESRKGRSIAPMTSDELVRLSRDRKWWYGPDS